MFLIRFVVSIVLNGVLLLCISRFLPELGFSVGPVENMSLTIFFAMSAVFWLINTLLRKVLGLVTLPAQILTL